MIGRPIIAVIALSLGACASCRPGENAQRGGVQEERLLAATVARDVAAVTRLLASGADSNKMVRDSEGHMESPWRLALHQARPNRRDVTDIVRAMAKAGANPEVAWGASSSRFSTDTYTVQRSTPLLEAVTNDVPDVVRALLDVRLDRNTGPVALELAVENGQTEIVHMLVEAGVDVNTTHAATTPLVAAISKRNVALMTYLEEHGAREKP